MPDTQGMFDPSWWDLNSWDSPIHMHAFSGILHIMTVSKGLVSGVCDCYIGLGSTL
jgi:hypothetical protein